MFAPHWLEPVPGLVQVMTPLVMVQPCDVNSASAVVRLNGYGFVGALASAAGTIAGNAVIDGKPYPLKTFLTMPSWSVASCIAWRMYRSEEHTSELQSLRH